MSFVEIRKAVVADAALILSFITELARYEKLESEVAATESDIRNSLFAESSTTSALICTLNGKPIAYAVYFFNYSTWLGKHGLYLEDLYVSPDYRNVGAGTALMKHLAKIALAKHCGRFEWSVLDWNEPAIKFYQAIGAIAQDEWVVYRLDGRALEKFASAA